MNTANPTPDITEAARQAADTIYGRGHTHAELRSIITQSILSVTAAQAQRPVDPTNVYVRVLQSECDVLRSRLEAANADAARLDWLETLRDPSIKTMIWRELGIDEETLRAAIDTAIGGTK